MQRMPLAITTFIFIILGTLGLYSKAEIEQVDPQAAPWVENISPYTDNRIEEDQAFILQFNDPVAAADIIQNTWCSVEGLGERVPVRLLNDKDRADILATQGLAREALKHPLHIATLACNRRLSANTKVQLIYGNKTTPSREQRFNYQVREPFKASFSCERANAQSQCLPIRPMVLQFNAPVAIKDLKKIRLVGEKINLKPLIPDNSSAKNALAESVSFASALPEQGKFSIEIPKNLKDASGRELYNADDFPLSVATDSMPPLAKFAASPFGIVERFAEPNGVALLPVTLRNVETTAKGKISSYQPTTDVDIIQWFKKVQKYDGTSLPRLTANKDLGKNVAKSIDASDKDYVQTRMLSLLAGQAGTKTVDLPTPVQKPQPFEVVGIPLSAGFHVLEIASQDLGASLLDTRHGAQRTMYVRTSALVTNLGVHFKLGRENALAWVTTLDKGLPAAGARVRVSDCKGREVASGSTDAQGIVQLSGIPPEPPSCIGDNVYINAYFVSARTKPSISSGKDTLEDMAFTWSDWNRGIEPWRFNLPTNRSAQVEEVAHTIFDRTLLRAGETVSMKHVLRTLTGKGFGLSPQHPGSLSITHVGSGQNYTQTVNWRKTATGGMSAESSFNIPPAAKLGLYQVELLGGANDRRYSTGEFRVEEFRLPILEGRIAPALKQTLVNVAKLPLQVQVNYVSGGGASQLPVQVSALVRSKYLGFEAYNDFQFSPPRADLEPSPNGGEEDTDSPLDGRVIMDNAPLVLDKNGNGAMVLEAIPSSQQPQELLLEASFPDPNGEVQTLRSTQTLWPAGVVAGIKTDGWVSNQGTVKFQALALDLNGKPKPGVSLQVTAVSRTFSSVRKRMVGGFYSYENKVHTEKLGSVCSGNSDERGLLLCETTLRASGEVELVVTAKDTDGNRIQAASSVYITKQGELWFGGDNNDRIDLLPEKRAYAPGAIAKFQVRMPFRYATALVAVEREGILHSEVVQLNGKDPTISLKVQPHWGPNVYVSVLALRGRLREVPWYSFFSWGYKAPREWWSSFWYEGREYIAPTALVDLSKPAFRLGVTEIQVNPDAHRLEVSVTANKESYAVREQAKLTIQVKLPNGKPAANAEVAVAAVDQALLELMPNNSWDLLGAMLERRSWGVETSTAQMEIIGRRHYGRKAVAPGGGGGNGGTRELLDTLLLWKPAVKLDAEGKAQVIVPLNDALSSFKIVAVADASTGLFGTGSTTIRSTQNLQIIQGLPPLVRENDQYRAQITLRNTTKQAMKVRVTPRATLLNVPVQTIDVPAGQAREVAWTVNAPNGLALTHNGSIMWEIEVQDTLSGARDALKISQRIIPAIPLTVRQSTLLQMDGPRQLDVLLPPDALASRGGIKVTMQARLADGMPSVMDWFANYAYSCLEQKVSKSIGLRDVKLWQSVQMQMPGYLDSDGLVSYFPPRDGEAHRGSDTLTAYLLAVSHEAAALNPAFALNAEYRSKMEQGLIAFVEGRIQREVWSPRKDLEMRKLAAIEALSRYGKAEARMLQSINITPDLWPTHAVIDWLNILRRVKDVAERDKRLAETQQILRSRIRYTGSKMLFSTEKNDYWWWLMHNSDTNGARLILSVLNDAAWKDDLGRLTSGLMARQNKGVWQTTTANLWGSLAMQKFSATMEATPVTGTTQLGTGSATTRFDWGKKDATLSALLPWSQSQPQPPLHMSHQGGGKPWVTVQTLAAVQVSSPQFAGYQLKKTIIPVEQAHKNLPVGSYTRGDVLRIRLEVVASADMTWAVISDPIPAGATILGNKLGRDSDIATQGERSGADDGSAFDERSFEGYRSYYSFLPKGRVSMEYTIRLNNAGEFSLPASRVEAMYAPEMFGELPNLPIKVLPQ